MAAAVSQRKVDCRVVMNQLLQTGSSNMNGDVMVSRSLLLLFGAAWVLTGSKAGAAMVSYEASGQLEEVFGGTATWTAVATFDSTAMSDQVVYVDEMQQFDVVLEYFGPIRHTLEREARNASDSGFVFDGALPGAKVIRSAGSSGNFYENRYSFDIIDEDTGVVETVSTVGFTLSESGVFANAIATGGGGGYEYSFIPGPAPVWSFVPEPASIAVLGLVVALRRRRAG